MHVPDDAQFSAEDREIVVDDAGDGVDCVNDVLAAQSIRHSVFMRGKEGGTYSDEVGDEDGDFGDFEDGGAIDGREDDVEGLSDEQEGLGDGSGQDRVDVDEDGRQSAFGQRRRRERV